MTLGTEQMRLHFAHCYKNNIAIWAYWAAKQKWRNCLMSLEVEGIDEAGYKKFIRQLEYLSTVNTPAEIAVSIAAQIIQVKNSVA
jgi:hypothetical protein